jgi:phage tail-like protein
MSLLGFRKEFIFIDVFNLQGAMVKSFKVFRCWVSEFQALPELDASGNAVMIQSIKIENEGWERDTSVTEPAAT